MDPNGYTKPTKILTLTDMRAKRILLLKKKFYPTFSSKTSIFIKKPKAVKINSWILMLNNKRP